MCPALRQVGLLDVVPVDHGLPRVDSVAFPQFRPLGCRDVYNATSGFHLRSQTAPSRAVCVPQPRPSAIWARVLPFTAQCAGPFLLTHNQTQPDSSSQRTRLAMLDRSGSYPSSARCPQTNGRYDSAQISLQEIRTQPNQLQSALDFDAFSRLADNISVRDVNDYQELYRSLRTQWCVEN